MDIKILNAPQAEISGKLKIWLVGNETTGNEGDLN